ncbi:MAG: nuclear transport factor 2 family protein [Parafilimonas sp.]
MKIIFSFILFIIITVTNATAQTGTAKTQNTSQMEKEITELEKQWAATIQKQDESQMDQFLADNYFLAIAIQGMPIRIVPKAVWLDNLKFYRTESFNIDDIKVHVYDGVAIVLMMFTQHATVRGQDRSGQFLITDIWVKQEKGWRVAERHSSRPEPGTAPLPIK